MKQILDVNAPNQETLFNGLLIIAVHLDVTKLLKELVVGCLGFSERIAFTIVCSGSDVILGCIYNGYQIIKLISSLVILESTLK